ncbi:MAG: hypothetical protein AAFX06_29345 [Planctomycetota bacterium]
MKKQNLALAALMIACSMGPATAQTFVNQTRRVDVFATARDAIFDEDQVLFEERESTRASGVFDDTVQGSASTITGDSNVFASQTSVIDDSDGSIWAEGNAISTVAEDGDASTDAESTFRLRFDLANPGQVVFSEILLQVSQPVVIGDPRGTERASEAFAFLRIFNQDTGVRVFNRTLRLNNAGDPDFIYEQAVVNLPAGRYRLLIRARAFGDNDNNMFQGEPHGARADFSIEAQITED